MPRLKRTLLAILTVAFLPGMVAERAYRSTIPAIAPILFDWVETRELVFFDDERCGLKLAHRTVEAGDYERALEISAHCVEGWELVLVR